MLESLRNKRIMVVAAHPDDEILGAGATMNRLIKNYGAVIRVVILGEGITSRADFRDTNMWQLELETHRRNIEKAKSAIGYQELSIHNFPDNRFDTVALLDIIKVIEKEKKSFQPEVIFTHFGGDLNIDHKKTFEAVMTACRPLQNEMVRTIFSFEVPSSTEWSASSEPGHFIPNVFTEIKEEDLKAKIAAMESYEYESRIFPHPRSSEALSVLARRWGIAVGRSYAEAFMLVRNISVI
jgi:LmbE family N-acetylglucosaminyl deacetylase